MDQVFGTGLATPSWQSATRIPAAAGGQCTQRQALTEKEFQMLKVREKLKGVPLGLIGRHRKIKNPRYVSTGGLGKKPGSVLLSREETPHYHRR